MPCNQTRLAAIAVAAMLFAPAAFADSDPMVGGHAMYSTKNIVENASASSDHTTLVAAVKQAGLVDTLQGSGPFTVFAPTNEAFAALPTGAVNTLMEPENKSKLGDILKYHVVAGDISSTKLEQMIKDGNGKAELKTVNGEQLTAMNNTSGNGIQLKDEKGGVANITIADVRQSNGEVHVIDKVMMPN